MRKFVIAMGLLVSILAMGPGFQAKAVTSHSSLADSIIKQMRGKIAGMRLPTAGTRLPKAPKPAPYSPTPTPAPAPTPPETTPQPSPAPMPTDSTKIWGAYLGGSSCSSFESLVGKKVGIVADFYGWGDAFPSSSDKSKSLLIFWEQYGVTLDSIISGGQDSYIKQFASQAKSYGGPVLLAPFHEMNGDWDPWGGTVGSNTPAKVVSAFKHVRDLFAGASNVKFVWAVNNDSVPDTQANAISNYWPGPSYVDYVGIDGFNFGNPWQSYSEVFSSAISQVKGYGKPILISSTASAAGSQKAQWITDALSKIKSDSSIKGFVWFNENKEQNWLVNSDQNSLQAFKEGIW